MTLETVRSLIRDVPDFPKPGILFKDITPLLAHPYGLRWVTHELKTRIDAIRKDQSVHAIAAVESRGFIFGATLAMEFQCAFVPIRKKGKLPAKVDQVSYQLEYGEGHLEMHKESIQKGYNVVFVDDVLATGGTASASAQLIRIQGGSVLCAAFVLELAFLAGRTHLNSMHVESLIQY